MSSLPLGTAHRTLPRRLQHADEEGGSLCAGERERVRCSIEFCSEELYLFSRNAAAYAGPRDQRAHMPVNLLCCLLTRVCNAVAARELGALRGIAFLLNMGMERFLERANEQGGAQYTQPVMQRLCRLARFDGRTLLREDRPGIQAFYDVLDGDARLAVSREERVLDGGGPSPTRQERWVHVYGSD